MSVDFDARVVRADEATGLIRQHPGLRVIDVRTPAEHASVHVPGAFNIPLSALGTYVATIRAVEQPILLVCQSGQRARRAEHVLREGGIDHVYVLDGGMTDWIAGGGPAVRGVIRLPLERQVRLAAGALAAAGGVLALTVSSLFALVPALVGSALVYAGVTGTCGMAALLAWLPYNRPRAADVRASVRALVTGVAPITAVPLSQSPGLTRP